MGKIKNAIKGFFHFTGEKALEGIKEAAGTVAPDKLMEHALGGEKAVLDRNKESEFTRYLRDLPAGTTPEGTKVQGQLRESDEEKMARIRAELNRMSVPKHLAENQGPEKDGAYELAWKEEMEKKEKDEAVKKQAGSQISVPQGKQARGMLGARKRKAQTGFEGLKKDTKSG